MRRRRFADPAGLASALASLPGLPRAELLARWRTLYGAEPPRKISRPILVRAIAYRMQEQVYGGLSPLTRRALARAAEAAAAGKPVAGEVGPPRLRPGTRLLRDWNGVTYEVIVSDTGVLFRGERYGSLSEVARAITGARWSGPRFFGLNAKRETQP